MGVLFIVYMHVYINMHIYLFIAGIYPKYCVPLRVFFYLRSALARNLFFILSRSSFSNALESRVC